MKNQVALLWGGHMVTTGRFTLVGYEFFQKGHTHNKVDQAFSRLNTKLQNYKEPLETLEDFMAAAQSCYVAGMEPIVTELLPTGYNWQEWLEPLSIGIGGLTPTAANPEVNHSWRVVQRADIPAYASGSEQHAIGWQIEDS